MGDAVIHWQQQEVLSHPGFQALLEASTSPQHPVSAETQHKAGHAFPGLLPSPVPISAQCLPVSTSNWEVWGGRGLSLALSSAPRVLHTPMSHLKPL